MKKRGFFYLALRAILRLLGIVKPRAVSKEEMCEQGKKVCNMDCKHCAWRNEDGEVRKL